MEERKEEIEKTGKRLTQEEFNKKVQEQLDDISRMFSNYKKKHQEDENKRDDEER